MIAYSEELKRKLVNQSHEAIKTLTTSAEILRKRHTAKKVNYFASFFKEAKNHIL